MKKEQQNKRLDPKLDIVFKALFGKAANSDMLISLLNGMLDLSQEDRITEIQILGLAPEMESVADKSVVMDLFVSDAKGHHYGIEMQCQNHRAFPERMLYYAARRYTEQLKRANEYMMLKPLVLLVFTDFELFPGMEGWKERFELRGKEHGRLFSKHISVLLVELPKFHKTMQEATELSEKWAIFLKEGTKMKTQVTDEVWVTPELKKAIAELELLEGDESMRELYEARLDQVRVRLTELHSSFEDGVEQGISQGESKAQQQNMLKLIARRWPELKAEAAPIISSLTELFALERLFDALLDAENIEAARAAIRAVQR